LLRADVVDALNERRAAKESCAVVFKRMMTYWYVKVNQRTCSSPSVSGQVPAEVQELSPTAEFIKQEPPFGEWKQMRTMKTKPFEQARFNDCINDEYRKETKRALR
jgi:hypothetical protein